MLLMHVSRYLHTKFVRYYLNFEGGGWCTSLDDCFGRGYGSGRRKGSSQGLPDPLNLDQLIGAWGTWYYSNDTAINPIMANWSKIEVLYCGKTDMLSRFNNVHVAR